MWGSELSPLQVSLCDTVIFQSVACTLTGMGLHISHNHPSYCLNVAFSLCSLLCLLEQDIFLDSLQPVWLKVVQQLVVILLLFMREGELRFFCSTILILFPGSSFSICILLSFRQALLLQQVGVWDLGDSQENECPFHESHGEFWSFDYQLLGIPDAFNKWCTFFHQKLV